MVGLYVSEDLPCQQQLQSSKDCCQQDFLHTCAELRRGHCCMNPMIQDKQASDPLDEVSSLMHLNRLERQAIKLTKGIEISKQDMDVSIGMFSVVDCFKLQEHYPLDGSTRSNRRRDLRGGATVCRLEVAGPNRLLFHAQRDEPWAGRACDDVRLLDDDHLVINSTITVCNRTIQYKQVYKRH